MSGEQPRLVDELRSRLSRANGMDRIGLLMLARDAIDAIDAIEAGATAAVPLDRAALAIDLLEALSALDGSKDVALDVTRPAIARNHLRAALARLSADEGGGIGKPRHSGPPYNDEGVPM